MGNGFSPLELSFSQLFRQIFEPIKLRVISKRHILLEINILPADLHATIIMQEHLRLFLRNFSEW